MPASTSRRAIRQHWPKRCGPYDSRTAAGSRSTSSAARLWREAISVWARPYCRPNRVNRPVSLRASPRSVEAMQKVPPRLEPRLAHSGGKRRIGQFQSDARLVVYAERVVQAAERPAPFADERA